MFYNLSTGINNEIPNINYEFNNDFSMGIVESIKISDSKFTSTTEWDRLYSSSYSTLIKRIQSWCVW